MSKPNDSKPFFVTGDFIPVTAAENRVDKETLMQGIGNIFSGTLGKMDLGISAANNGDIIRTASKEESSDIFDNPILPKFFREAQNIKDDNWQKVSTSSRLSDDGISDFRAVSPARSSEETNSGGRGHLKGALASIFNPTALEDVRNDQYTNVVLSDAQRRKAEAEAKKEGNRDWENVVPSANSKNISPTQMGFTPSRTAWQPAPLEPVKIAEVEGIVKSNAESAEAGKKAAQIKAELDKAFAAKWEKDFADKRGWEDVEHEKIIENQDREMKIAESTIKIKEDFIKPTQEVNLANLSEIFNKPDPEQFKEASIKRDSSVLGKRRARREDDRSWESLNNARSRKW